MWGEIVELAKEIEWPTDHAARHAIGSSYYGLYLYEIYRIVMELQATEMRQQWDSIASLIAEYDAAWSRYYQLAEDYPEVATLYSKDYVRHHSTNAESEVNRLRDTLQQK